MQRTFTTEQVLSLTTKFLMVPYEEVCEIIDFLVNAPEVLTHDNRFAIEIATEMVEKQLPWTKNVSGKYFDKKNAKTKVASLSNKYGNKHILKSMK